jgi:MarR family transcriptional regulator for hemolysin
MQIKQHADWAAFVPLLIACGRNWRRSLSILLADSNLSDATAAPLIALLKDGDRVPQGVLAERIGVEGPSLVRLLDGLEAEGLVRRLPDDKDRRVKLVELTPTGHMMARRAEACAAQLRAELLADIDPASVAATLRVLGAIATKTSPFPEDVDHVG